MGRRRGESPFSARRPRLPEASDRGAGAGGAPVRPEILRNPGRARDAASAGTSYAAAAAAHARGSTLAPGVRCGGRDASERTHLCRRLDRRGRGPASAGVGLAQKTSYDYDKTADFAAFKTYALKDGTKVGQQLIDDRIVAAIEQELAAKGLTKADANPDVFVVYHVAFDKQKDISTYSSGYGGGYGAYGWG